MSYASTVLADGAVGFWQMAEPSGTTATDTAGTKSGTYSGTVTLGQTGIPGGGGATAALFTRAGNGLLTVGDAAGLHVGNTGTTEIWAKLATASIHQNLWSDTNTGHGFTMDIIATNKFETANTGSAVVADSTTTLAVDGSFHHIVWTKATSTNHMYIDGVDRTGSVTDHTLANSLSLVIGGLSAGSGVQYFDGTLAMAALYPTALSAATVSNHFTLGSTPFLEQPNFPRTNQTVSRAATR